MLFYFGYLLRCHWHGNIGRFFNRKIWAIIIKIFILVWNRVLRFEFLEIRFSTKKTIFRKKKYNFSKKIRFFEKNTIFRKKIRFFEKNTIFRKKIHFFAKKCNFRAKISVESTNILHKNIQWCTYKSASQEFSGLLS